MLKSHSVWLPPCNYITHTLRCTFASGACVSVLVCECVVLTDITTVRELLAKSSWRPLSWRPKTESLAALWELVREQD